MITAPRAAAVTSVSVGQGHADRRARVGRRRVHDRHEHVQLPSPDQHHQRPCLRAPLRVHRLHPHRGPRIDGELPEID